MPVLLQMMAAVRCKKSKWLFILGTLLGKHWDEDELFHSAEEVGSSRPAHAHAHADKLFIAVLLASSLRLLSR